MATREKSQTTYGTEEIALDDVRAIVEDAVNEIDKKTAEKKSQIDEKVQGVRNTVNSIQNKVSTIGKKVESLEGTVNGFQTAVGSLQEGVNNLQDSVDIIDENISNLGTGVSGIDTKIDGVQTGVSGIDTKVKDVQSGVDKIENTVNGIQTDVGEVDKKVQGVKSDVSKLGTGIANAKTELQKSIDVSEKSVCNQIATDLTQKFDGMNEKVAGAIKDSMKNAVKQIDNDKIADILSQKIVEQNNVNYKGLISKIDTGISDVSIQLNAKTNGINSRVDQKTKELSSQMEEKTGALSTDLESILKAVKDAQGRTFTSGFTMIYVAVCLLGGMLSAIGFMMQNFVFGMGMVSLIVSSGALTLLFLMNIAAHFAKWRDSGTWGNVYCFLGFLVSFGALSLSFCALFL